MYRCQITFFLVNAVLPFKAISETQGPEDTSLSEHVRQVILAYTPNNWSTLVAERGFNDLRTAERLQRSKSKVGNFQLQNITIKSVQRNFADHEGNFEACLPSRF
jgi:hypothetical protein